MANSYQDNEISLPNSTEYIISNKHHKYALCIPVINEGEKFISQMQKMKEMGISDLVDIIICDGGSSDGSTDLELLKNMNISFLIVKTSPGKLSDQLMLGYYFAMCQGYKGTITMDGNCKDGLDGIEKMINCLEEGYDLIQGSRYRNGGVAINTPKLREIAIRLIHVPIINKLSGAIYTDTTNGFRAHSIRVFEDKRIHPFRYGVFPTYSLIHYLTVRVPQLNYKVCEVSVLRQYPAKGKTPTKISFVKGNYDLLKILFNLIRHKYDPKGIQ